MALKYILVIATLLACTKTELPDREMTYEEFYTKKKELDSLNKYFVSRKKLLWRKALKLKKEITKSQITKDYYMKKAELDSIYECIKSLTEEWSNKTHLLEEKILPLFVEIPPKLQTKDLYIISNWPPYLSSNGFGIRVFPYFQILKENSFLLLTIVNTSFEKKDIIIARYLEKYIEIYDSGIVGHPTEYTLKDHYCVTIDPLNYSILRYPSQLGDSYYSLIVYLEGERFYHQFFHLGYTGKPIYHLCKKVKNELSNVFHHGVNITFRGVDVVKVISDPVVSSGDKVIYTYYWKPSYFIKKNQSLIKIEIKILPGIKIYNQEDWKTEIIRNKFVVTCPLDSSHNLDSLKFSFRAPYTLLRPKIYESKDSLVCFKFLGPSKKAKSVTTNQTIPVVIKPIFLLPNFAAALNHHARK